VKTSRPAAAIAAAGVLSLAPVVGVVAIAAASAPAAASSGPAGGLRPGSVPAGYADAVTRGGLACPALSAPLLAAQIEAESGWNPAAVSPAGAEGLAQFLPATWASYGVDANGDGSADLLDPLDSIASAAQYDCALAAAVAGVPGDRATLMLAAYNAGPAAVIAFRGVPPYPETQGYVRRIGELAASYTATPATPAVAAPASGAAGSVIAAGMSVLGTPYSWGGGSAAGPSAGIDQGAGTVGFDCSGLTSWVFATVGVALPRTAAGQEAVSRPTSSPRPGDLVFFGAPGAAYHVSIYLGGGQMLDAPHTGAVVRVEPVWDGARYGQVLA